MRISFCKASLLMIVMANTACSSMLANSGKHSDTLRLGAYREAVIRDIGQPISTQFNVKLEHPTKGDCLIDTYVLKGKKPDRARADDYAAMGIFTFGLSELILTPVELARTAKESFATHRILLTYCPSGGRMILDRQPAYEDTKP